MKKRDIILIIVLLAAAGLLRLVFLLPRKDAGGTMYAVAKIDGKEAGRWPLSEDTEAAIDSAYGRNLLVIRNGEAMITEADCPDGYCTEMHAVGKAGGSIICLPHHLEIGIYAENGEKADEGVDGIVK